MDAYRAAESLVGNLFALSGIGGLLTAPLNPDMVRWFHESHRRLLTEVRALADALRPALAELTETAVANNEGVVSACGVSGANAHDVIYRIGDRLVIDLLCALGGESGAEPGSMVQCHLSESNYQAVHGVLTRLDHGELTRLEGLARQESILTWKRIADAAALGATAKPNKGAGNGDDQPLPRSIQEIPDAELRWQAGRTWRAAGDLLDCIEESHCLIERLETGAEVSLPEWERLYENAGRAANMLCDTGAVPEDITPIKIIAAFPKPPNPVAGWQKQYDVDQARLKKSPLWDLATQLAAIRTQAETCPKTLLTPLAVKPNEGEGNGGKKRRGAPAKRETKQRADYAKPLVDQGLTWLEIFERYAKTAKGKADKAANADAMRLAYGREYPAK